jgi:hypothetical protein
MKVGGKATIEQVLEAVSTDIYIMLLLRKVFYPLFYPGPGLNQLLKAGPFYPNSSAKGACETCGLMNIVVEVYL